MAKEELLVTVGLSANKFKDELKRINSDLRASEKNFKTVEKTVGLMEKSTETLGKSLKALSSVLEAQNSKIKAYENRLNELKNTSKELEKNKIELQNRLNNLRTEYDKVANSLGENSKEAKNLTKEINSLEKEISQNEKAINRTSSEFDRLNNNLNSTQLEADYTRAKMDSLQKEMDNINTDEATNEMNQLDSAMENASNESKKLESNLKDVGTTFNNIGNSIKGTGQSLTTSITLPVVGAGVAFTKIAADADEMQSKFDTVFKTTSKDVEEWSKKLGESIGRSSIDIKEAVSNSADLLIGMGLTEEEAGKLSQQFIELAYDLGSFNNVSDSKAIEAMTKAMMGETEMAKSLGVNLSVATLEQSEYVKSLGKAWKDLTQAEKAQAYYAEAVKQSTNAIGDAARTSDSLTNRTRALQGRLKDLSKEFGDKLLPLALQVVNKVIAIVEAFSKLDDKTQTIILVVAGLSAVIGPLLIIIGQLSIGIGAVATAFGVLAGLSAPIITSISLIGLVISGLVYSFKNNSEDMSATIENLKIKFAESWGSIKNSMEIAWQVMTDVWKTVGEPLLNAISELIEIVVNFVADIMPLISDTFSIVCDLLKLAWDNVGKPLFDFIMEVVNIVVEWFRQYMPIIADVFNSVMSSLKKLWDNIGEPVFKILKAVIEGVIEAVKPIISSLADVFGNMVNIISKLWKGILKPVFDGLIEVCGWLISKAMPHLENFKNGVTSVMKYVLSPIQWVIDKIGGLLDLISRGTDAVVNFASKFNPFKSIDGPEIQATYSVSPLDESLTRDIGIYTPNSPLSNVINQGRNSNLGFNNSSIDKLINSFSKQRNSDVGGITLNIENFNNNRDIDIRSLVEEIEFYRKQTSLRGAY